MSPESPASQFTSLLVSGPPPGGQSLSQFWSRPDGRLHIQWYRGQSTVHFTPHTHSEFNIVLTLNGAVETAQMGEHCLIEPGAAMMGSNPGVEHSSWYRPGLHGCQAVSLTFTPDLLPEIPTSLAFLGSVQSPRLLASASEIAEEMLHRRLGYEAVIEGLAIRILIECLRLWPASRRESISFDPTPRLSRRDHIRAFEFMRWCRKDAFRIQHLCRVLGTSEERFNRLFRASTKESPASFYQTLLLTEACHLLADARLPVKEVSYRLGYKTPSHFVSSFRRHFGCTPQDFRLRLHS